MNKNCFVKLLLTTQDKRMEFLWQLESDVLNRTWEKSGDWVVSTAFELENYGSNTIAGKWESEEIIQMDISDDQARALLS